MRMLTFVLSLLTAALPLAARAELKAGDAAPEFSAQGDDGRTYRLSEFKGKPVILYFYPKDQTPGCTVQARKFRDDYAQFQAKGAVILGVSMDDAASHRAFRARERINFPLLVGTPELAKAYGVSVTFGFSARDTFVIGRDGKLIKVMRGVDVSNHSAEVLSLIP